MVRQASSASISSQKGKQATNKNKKRNYNANKIKSGSKTKIQYAKNKCLMCKEKAALSALNK